MIILQTIHSIPYLVYDAGLGFISSKSVREILSSSFLSLLWGELIKSLLVFGEFFIVVTYSIHEETYASLGYIINIIISGEMIIQCSYYIIELFLCVTCNISVESPLELISS